MESTSFQDLMRHCGLHPPSTEQVTRLTMSLHFLLTYYFTVTSLSSDSPLCSSITLSLSFTPGLKPTCFTNPTHSSFTSSFQTAVTDFCLDRFFLSYSVFVFSFGLIFSFLCCALDLSWPYCQLLSAR